MADDSDGRWVANGRSYTLTHAIWPATSHLPSEVNKFLLVYVILLKCVNLVVALPQ